MEIVLNAEKREEIGKKPSKSLRREGRIPSVYYVHGEDSVHVSVDENDFRSILQSEASIIDLKIDGKVSKSVIRDIQWDPIYGDPLHVDFMGINLKEKLQVTLPIYVIGTPLGVSQDGGVLQQIVREIEIECLPLDIPEHLEIDVSHLEIGDNIRIEDLPVDKEKVEVLNEPDQTVAVVRPPVLEAELEEEAEEEPAEPELIGEKKEEDEEEGEGEGEGEEEEKTE